jgi:hypothetical protein
MSDFDDFVGSLSEDQKKKLFQALVGNENTNNTTSAKSANVDENFIVKKAETQSQIRRKEAVKARKNEWEDTGEFRDISTPDVERTPRRRPPPQKSDVECHVCGKSFKVDPRFAYGEYYRCNKCSGKK